MALPFEPLSRTISLTARRGVLGDMPAQMAARLRPVLKELIVDPTIERVPWLSGQMKVF